MFCRETVLVLYDRHYVRDTYFELRTKAYYALSSSQLLVTKKIRILRLHAAQAYSCHIF